LFDGSTTFVDVFRRRGGDKLKSEVAESIVAAGVTDTGAAGEGD
jgi:hypothetical protein